MILLEKYMKLNRETYALNNLYPKLSTGGFCIIDDYGCLKNCKEAVDDYRAKNQIDDEIKVIDWTGIYWRKS